MAIVQRPSRASVMALAQMRFKLPQGANRLKPVGVYADANPSYAATAGAGSPAYEVRPLELMGEADSEVLVLNGSSSLLLPSINGLQASSGSVGAWIRRNGNQDAFDTIFGWRGRMQLLGCNSAGQQEAAYNWDDTNVHWQWNDGPSIPNNEWVYVLFSSTPTGTTVRVSDASNVNPSGVSSPFTFDSQTGAIGADPPVGRFFTGRIFEPTFWTSGLTDEQMLVAAGGEEPEFTSPMTIVTGQDGDWYVEAYPGGINLKGHTILQHYYDVYDMNGNPIFEEAPISSQAGLGPPGVYEVRQQIQTDRGPFSLWNGAFASQIVYVGVPEPSGSGSSYRGLSRNLVREITRPIGRGIVQ